MGDTLLVWDQIGEKFYETGLDHGVLYVMDNNAYGNGVAWNGLISVTENPSGAEATALYADNIEYMNMYSVEEFGATIEAYMYPDEFKACNGEATLATGVEIGQQDRKTFGLCYRTKIGNDSDGDNHGYKIHIIYGAKASPSERAYNTINDSPEAIQMSWEISTVPVPVKNFKPTAYLVIDSRTIASAKLTDLETILYGTPAVTGTNAAAAVPARLPLPDEIKTIVTGS